MDVCGDTQALNAAHMSSMSDQGQFLTMSEDIPTTDQNTGGVSAIIMSTQYRVYS